MFGFTINLYLCEDFIYGKSNQVKFSLFTTRTKGIFRFST